MVAASPRLVAAMTFLSKSKDGLSNSELDELTSDNSNWETIWTVRQLLSLGFSEYRVDHFGGPARYALTELGRNVFAVISGKPLPAAPKPAAPAPVVQAAAAQAPKS